jgi:hypothetical protein
MAENTVVKDQLTSAMVEAGAELASKLDEMGVATTAALWLFEPELNEWRLVFASSEVATRGPREIYEKIRLAIGQLKEKATAVPLSAVVLMDANADLIRLLRVALKTDGGINRIRFSKNVINGHFIDDALIYRIS